MAENSALHTAMSDKNDEFYTLYSDIEREMNSYIDFNPKVFNGKTVLLPCDDPEWSNFTRYFAANFERLGLKKLISTSYSKGAGNKQMTLFELGSSYYDEEKHSTKGKLFVLEYDKDNSGTIDINDIEFSGYLEGDGDFRSEEVKKLRDEADIIVTNPPFSLFREFMSWLNESKKEFIVIGNMNAVKYREIFPLLQQNKIWLGTTNPKEFVVPEILSTRNNMYTNPDGVTFAKFGNICWFTNIDHGLRHSPLLLDTMKNNLKFNKKLIKRLKKIFGKTEYVKYANYDAIEVPYVECIPSDYDGIMGVPISFLEKYNPEQFDLIGRTGNIEWAESDECNFFIPPTEDEKLIYKQQTKTWRVQNAYYVDEKGIANTTYDRFFIRRKMKE